MAVGPDPVTPREERRRVKLEASVRLPGRQPVPVTILDLTYEGCKIAAPVQLLVGDKLQLTVPKLGVLESEVRWYANGRAGLRFLHADPSPLETSSKQARAEPSITASLRRTGQTPYQVSIFDLSPTGCKVEFVERPAIGERLWAKFDGLDSIEATVSWLDGFQGGIEFARPIHPAVFDRLQQRLR